LYCSGFANLKKMARVLLTTFGSYGDLHPYLAIGKELQALGHQAVIATSASYREKIESTGLRFTAIRPDVSLADPETIRYFLDRWRGTERVVRAMVSVVRETYEDTLEAARAADMIVTHPLSFAAVMIAQQLKLPWVSTVLAPGSFLSAYDPPVPAPTPWLVKFRALGPGAMRAVWRLVTPMIRSWCRPVFDLRREIGLEPGGNPLFEGGNSPALVLVLFSSVFAQPQPDWPPQAKVTGFPFYEDSVQDLAPELSAFLKAAPPPVILTLGSTAVAAPGDFYSTSLEAIQRLNARALFLTGPPAPDLPMRWPAGVLAWPYAPHEQVFTYASAIVHPGGIGTMAQALRSGRPMLVMPFANDQFDNAARVQRLGAGISIPRHEYRASAAFDALERLISTATYRDAAGAAATIIRSEAGARRAAEEIDQYWSTSSLKRA
jgi:UDP:flavonoid glycosyltransferase YjiC (YdhE family)